MYGSVHIQRHGVAFVRCPFVFTTICQISLLARNKNTTLYQVLNSGIGGANTYPAAVHVDWLPVPVATTSPLAHVNVHLLPATLVHVEGTTRLVVAAAGHVHVTGGGVGGGGGT
jgi:hypothetical protein